MPPDLGERAVEEIVDLHRVFEAWIGRGEGNPARFEAAFDPDFAMVPPDGRTMDRAAVLAMLERARGARGTGFRIMVEAPVVVWRSGAHVLVGYVERQWSDAGETARRSTALMRGRDEGAPAWCFVQETWITA